MFKKKKVLKFLNHYQASLCQIFQLDAHIINLVFKHPTFSQKHQNQLHTYMHQPSIKLNKNSCIIKPISHQLSATPSINFSSSTSTNSWPFLMPRSSHQSTMFQPFNHYVPATKHTPFSATTCTNWCHHQAPMFSQYSTIFQPLFNHNQVTFWLNTNTQNSAIFVHHNAPVSSHFSAIKTP